MTKIKILLIAVFLLAMASCHRPLSEEMQKQLLKTENLWKQRKLIAKMEQKNIVFPQEKDTSINENRINRIYLDNMECQFEVLVDDVLLMRIMGPITQNGGGITGDHDINQLLLTSGTHQVTVRMFPRYGRPVFGEEGYVHLKFSHFTHSTFKKPTYFADMNANNGINIDQLEKQWIEKWDQENQVGYDGDFASKQPDKFLGLPVYEWNKTFTAEVPFKLLGWRNSVNLAKEQEEEKRDVENELIGEYQKIHQLFSKRDIEAYLALVAEREDLITQSLYYRESDKLLRKQEIVKLMQDPNYEIQPMLKETFHLDFQGYGNLVSMVNKLDGEGIIRLKNKNDPDDNIYLDFRFHRKNKGDKLTVI